MQSTTRNTLTRLSGIFLVMRVSNLVHKINEYPSNQRVRKLPNNWDHMRPSSNEFQDETEDHHFGTKPNDIGEFNRVVRLCNQVNHYNLKRNQYERRHREKSDKCTNRDKYEFHLKLLLKPLL
jgi:hypothetical protein